MEFNPVVEVKYKGDLYTDATYLPSNYNVVTSVRNKDYPSPTELLACALGSCMVSNVAYAANNRVHIDEQKLAVKIEIVMQDKPVHRLVGIKAQLTVGSLHPLSEKDKLIIEKAATTCAVKNSLKEDILFEIEFIYP